MVPLFQIWFYVDTSLLLGVLQLASGAAKVCVMTRLLVGQHSLGTLDTSLRIQVNISAFFSFAFYPFFVLFIFILKVVFTGWDKEDRK